MWHILHPSQWKLFHLKTSHDCLQFELESVQKNHCIFSSRNRYINFLFSHASQTDCGKLIPVRCTKFTQLLIFQRRMFDIKCFPQRQKTTTAKIKNKYKQILLSHLLMFTPEAIHARCCSYCCWRQDFHFIGLKLLCFLSVLIFCVGIELTLFFRGVEGWFVCLYMWIVLFYAFFGFPSEEAWLMWNIRSRFYFFAGDTKPKLIKSLSKNVG